MANMIKVKIRGIGKSFVSFEASGHANSNQYGHDLVCAAVSSVVIGGFNSIKETNKFKFDVKEGYAKMEAKETISDYDEAVINTIITSLKTIEETNPSFVKIEIL